MKVIFQVYPGEQGEVKRPMKFELKIFKNLADEPVTRAALSPLLFNNSRVCNLNSSVYFHYFVFFSSMILLVSSKSNEFRHLLCPLYQGKIIGGCTVNLVANESVEKFANTLARGYETETGLHPEIYISRASNGAKLLSA